MRHVKLFESFTVQQTIDNIDDIAAYIPTHTSAVESKWVLPNFDLDKILNDDQYNKYPINAIIDFEYKLYATNRAGIPKSSYIRYYTIGFYELNNLFISESDIRNRAKHYGLKFFVINFNQENRLCKVVFFSEDDWNKIDIEGTTKNINKKGWDILLEEDVKVERNEFDIIYEDDDIMAVKPKTYRAAIRYSSDAAWKAGLKKNKEWIEKYMTPGAYYGGTNWYKSKTVKIEVESWWRKLLKLPPKQSEKELREFFNDFPRYLFYIVIFKKLPVEDEMSKLYLLYDVSRGEYGQLPHDFTSSYAIDGYWGDMLDASHNQVKVVQTNGKMVTLKDIHNRHRNLFSRAFREIESNFTQEKDRMYDLLGFWADKGSEYRDDALVFIRSSRTPDRLQVTRPKLMIKNDDGSISWTKLGFYDDPDFDYWELDKEKPNEKEVPNQGRGYKDYFKSIGDNVNKLKDALEDGWKL